MISAIKKLVENDNKTDYLKMLIKKLSSKNYYFLSGYDTHAVFVCKYNQMIIIGNAGGGVMSEDIDANRMVKVIKYYQFKIEFIMILILYMFLYLVLLNKNAFLLIQYYNLILLNFD